jgi:phospholipase A1
LKTKIAQNIFGKGVFWQVYKVKFSRPFREANYELELIFNYPVKSNFLGLKMKMLGFSFNHQSNGREGKQFSSSWNTLVLKTKIGVCSIGANIESE